ncbi:condensation domain protein [Mycobacterium xenopi 3993]|nr:condensation domain protein [Mycobacterium xenopi 3993]
MIPGDRADFGWQVVNAAGWSASRLGEAIDVVARYAFDLETEIPLRATLFRASDDEHVLVVVLHHIAADGWSITPLVRDLGAAYASRCAGRAPSWAPLAVQYADYTLWQRRQLGELDDPHSPIAGQLAYWEQALAGLPERLELPTDRPYPAVADQRGPVWPSSGRPSCNSRSRGWPASTTRPASWWSRPPWRCCCRSCAPAVRSRWGSRSQAGVTPHWTSWSGFSSTPWSCGSTWVAIPVSVSC